MDRSVKLLVVYGPTGSGKSALAVRIAQERNGEIVSADSRQTYRRMDIGTGKIRTEEMAGIPHYLIDVVNPNETYVVSDFKRDALERIENIRSRGKLPILCGGTGLFIDSVVFDLEVENSSNDPEYRAELENFRREHGNDALWERLRSLDPEYAAELHPNAYTYVMRGLEVLKTTGKSKREFRTERRLRFPTEFVTPYDDAHRSELYERINDRVEGMFRDGLVEEVENLLRSGYSRSDPWFGSIGYREVLDFIDGTLSLETAKERMKQLNRNYAKRQVTWCKRYVLPNDENLLSTGFRL